MAVDEPNEITFNIYKNDSVDKRKELLVNMVRIQEAFYLCLNTLTLELIRDKKEMAILKKIFNDVSNAVVKLSKKKIHVSYIAKFLLFTKVDCNKICN